MSVTEIAKCRECEHWSPAGPAPLVGDCNVPAISRGYAMPFWYGARRCPAFVLAVGVRAVEQLDAIARGLLKLPDDVRKLTLDRMRREDDSAAQAVRGRIVALFRGEP